MHNEDGVENALENKNYPFSLFCMKNSFVMKDASMKSTSEILRSLIILTDPTWWLQSGYPLLSTLKADIFSCFIDDFYDRPCQFLIGCLHVRFCTLRLSSWWMELTREFAVVCPRHSRQLNTYSKMWIPRHKIACVNNL